MANILSMFKTLKINAEQLRSELGNDLYNVSDIKAEKIYAKDVVFVIEQYLSGKITLSILLDWVNIVWFTDLYTYNPIEEDAIASVMTVLETLDEDDVSLSRKDFLKMIDSLNRNISY